MFRSSLLYASQHSNPLYPLEGIENIPIGFLGGFIISLCLHSISDHENIFSGLCPSRSTPNFPRIFGLPPRHCAFREFDGTLVRHGKYVFLDVLWLAKVLKPLLNHKDEEAYNGSLKLGDTGDTCITLSDQLDIASWGRLKKEGILEPRLARALWPDDLSEYLLPTLVSLGLAFSLGDDARNDPAGGLVVLLRLEPSRPARVGKEMDRIRADAASTFTAKWEFFLGVPPGAIEKVLTRCCGMGGVRMFWRFGVFLHSSFGDGGGSGGRFAAALEYSSRGNRLTADLFGDISNPAPWAALSYVMSIVRSMLLEFPGLACKGSLGCPLHGDAMPLTFTVSL